MRFAHLADVHIGSWRDPRMREKSMQALVLTIDRCISEPVDFVLIAGDLFNTALPPIDLIRRTVEQFMRLKHAGIPIYLIAGSHDYSAGGRTMLDVLEETGLFINVMRGTADEQGLTLRFTTDERTGAKITGILGKAAMLDKQYYTALQRDNLANEPGYKIFLFHTAISEYMPEGYEGMDTAPLSLLPKGFQYYAGGHVHIRSIIKDPTYGTLAYPGPLFPANFEELEELSYGSFILVDENGPTFVPLKLNPHLSLKLSVSGKSTAILKEELDRYIEEHDFTDAFVTMRITGRLHDGNLEDLELKESIEKIYNKGAYYVMRNTAGVDIKTLEQIKLTGRSKEEIEDALINNISPLPLAEDTTAFVKQLMHSLAVQKQEGERSSDYEERALREAQSVIKMVMDNENHKQ